MSVENVFTLSGFPPYKNLYPILKPLKRGFKMGAKIPPSVVMI
jgi:hypothetical protein